jgi:hypothetical protein
MRYLLFIFVFWISLCAGAQNIGARADSLYNAKDYHAAAPTYVWAANLNEFRGAKASSYYNAACCYALTGSKDSAFICLEKAKEFGWTNKSHLMSDADLNSLHEEREWKKFTKNMKAQNTWSSNPKKAELITTDITHFWEAYELAQRDSVHRLAIYQQYYIDKGTPGLQDYFTMKVGDMHSFVRGHDRKAKFYAAIHANTLMIEKQKPLMIESFARFKKIYPDAKFPPVCFVIGNWTSGGTASNNGLLIGADQYMKSDDIPVDELNLWEKNNFQSIKNLPYVIAHELIHFNQTNLAQDTTLLCAAIREGMADFLGELMSGKTANERLHLYAKGREKQIWDDFKKEMWLNKGYAWIGNGNQETKERPADLGYWVGYTICKAYYDNATNKKQAVYEILHIRDYKAFYEKSNVEAQLLAASY